MTALQLPAGPSSQAATTGLSVAGFSRSAGCFGGDDYEVFPTRTGASCLLIADAMGTGRRSAHLVNRFRTEVHRAAHWTEAPAELLDFANRSLFCELDQADAFITAQIARWEPVAGILRLANAGHCPMLLGFETVEAVAPDGLPLGIAPRTAYEEYSLPLDPGS